MRIAIVSTILGRWGGSEELWAAVAGDALGTGHEVLASVWEEEASAPRIEELRRRGMALSVRKTHGLGRAARWIHRVADPLRRVMAWRPDVVLISQGSTFDCARLPAYGPFLEWLRVRPVPYVVVSHGNLLGPEYMPDSSVRARAHPFFQAAHRMGFVAQRLRRIAEIQMSGAIRNPVIVRNPVALADRTVVPWPVSDEVRLACVARLDAYVKGYDLLFEALGEEPWRSRNWRLLMFGEGPDLGYLRSLADDLGLSEAGRIEFRGHVDDVRAIWKECHLLVLASRTEGVPLGLVEAMVCGRPSVVTDVGGVGEWVSEPQSGFVAPGATAASIGAALERAWTARAEWPEMGRRAHEVAAPRIGDPGRDLLNLLESATAGV